MELDGTEMRHTRTVPWATALFRGLSSVQLGVVLLTALAGVLVSATIVEKERGTEYVQWFVYRESWFFALWGLLGVNVLAAMIRRNRWRPAQWGFLAAHGGVLVLMLGALWTHYAGVEGMMNLAESEAGDEFFVPKVSRLNVAWAGQRDDREIRSRDVLFEPGPVEWPEGKTRDFGYSNGVGITILRYLPHAVIRDEWAPDASGKGRSAAEFALLDAEGETVRTLWTEVDKTFARKPGETFSMGERLRMKVLRYLPSARRTMTAIGVKPDLKAGETADAAVLVQLDAGGASRQLWLLRDDPRFGVQVSQTPEGPVRISFGYERLSLDFSVKLIRFERKMNPGGMGDASYSSTVQIIDRAAGRDEEQTISMNRPMAYGKYRFFQSGFDSRSDGVPVTILTVARDPGRLMKHIGCGMILVGMGWVFLKRRRRGVEECGMRNAECGIQSMEGGG